MRLLLCEDERSLSRAIEAILKRNNYSVDAVYNGKDALDYITVGNYDGIILDIMMPIMDGIEVLKAIRAQKINTPVLILSARSEIDDKVKGLDMGANDYITKPFGLREFIARINANITKIHVPVKKVIKIRDLIINLDEHKCYLKGNLVDLTNIEFELLNILMHSPDIVVTRKKLLKDVWNFEEDSETRTLDMHIKSIRKKLAGFTEESYIETIRGIGFVINGKTL